MIDVNSLPMAEDTEEIGTGLFWELDDEHLLKALGNDVFDVIHCHYNGYSMEYTQKLRGFLSDVDKWMNN